MKTLEKLKSKSFQVGLFVLTIGTLLAVSVTGCALIGKSPKPLSQFEEVYFDRQTNQIPVVTQTIETNTAGLPVTVFKTNQVEIYTVKPSTEGQGLTSWLGSLVGLFVPGSQGGVTTGALALLSLWAYLRSSKNGQVNTALVQEIETILTFIGSLPNGSTYKLALVKFLQDHQIEANVLSQVLTLLKNSVSSNDAKMTATEINAHLEELLKQTKQT